MKLGQLGSVKLSPKLLSKGLGRGLGLLVAEAALPLVADEPATVVDVPERVAVEPATVVDVPE